MILLDLLPLLKEPAKKLLLQNEIKTLEQHLTTVSTISFGKDFKTSMHSQFIYANNTIGICPVKESIEELYYDEFMETLHKETPIEHVIDYRDAIEEEVYISGKAIVVDKKSELAFYGVNNLSDETLFEEICEDFEWTPIVFSLPNNSYTSQMMWMNEKIVFLCLDFISDKKEKKQVLTQIKNTGKQVVSISLEQVQKGILNFIDSKDQLIINQTSYNLFTPKQQAQIATHQNIKTLNTPVIDDLGLLYQDICFCSE